MSCVADPFNEKDEPVLVNAPLAILQLPPSVSIKLPATKVPLLNVKLLRMLREPLAVFVPAVEIIRLP